MPDLRTRIAAAIMSCHGVFVDDAVNAAEAVIAELGLVQEWGIRERKEAEPCFLDTDKKSLEGWLRPENTMMTRWITNWVSDPTDMVTE